MTWSGSAPFSSTGWTKNQGYVSSRERETLAIANALASNLRIPLLDGLFVDTSFEIAPLFGGWVELNWSGQTVLVSEQNIRKGPEIAVRGYPAWRARRL